MPDFDDIEYFDEVPDNSANLTPISLRVDTDVLEWFRAGGRGWQTRMKDVLRTHMLARGKDFWNGTP